MTSVRDFVVSVLSVRFPLTAKQLYSIISRKSEKPVSYQAVHKAIVLLVKEGVLDKYGNFYRLSNKWIQGKKAELSRIESNYFRKEPDLQLPQQVLFFDSLLETDRFLIGSFISIASKMSTIPVLHLLWSHFWIPLFISKKEYSALTKFARNITAFDGCVSNTPIDKWCCSFWKKHGWNSKAGLCNEAGLSDIIVFGDYVIQVFYPEEIKKEIDKVYLKTKTVSELDIDSFFNKVFEKKTRIPVVIIRNSDLAEQLGKKIKSYFY